jgi:hypothetical protein
MALDLPELSPRELATRFTDTDGYFVSESSVYRLLKAHDLITSPAFIVIKGGGRVQGQDDGPQPALADRLHLSQGHRLGLVLSVNHPRRLLTLHHRLEVVHDHAGRRRNRHPATRPHGIWVCCSARRPQTAIAQRQRFQPRLWRLAKCYVLGILLNQVVIYAFKDSKLLIIMTFNLAWGLLVLTIAMCVFAAVSAIFKVVRIDPAVVRRRSSMEPILVASSKCKSIASSITTIIGDTMKACKNSPRPMCTSDPARPSCFNAKGPNETPSN